jgi:hypothetical protein
MTGTNCDLFTHNQSRSYLNHLVYIHIASLFLCLSWALIKNGISIRNNELKSILIKQPKGIKAEGLKTRVVCVCVHVFVCFR